MSRLARFAWVVLGYNLAVIVWGAYVRATGSGAGCGAHWPLCNGVAIPRDAGVATLIEFSHRLTSGVALLAVVALCAWTWRRCHTGHPARVGSALALLFMLTEAAVGAGLVLFQMVADNASIARAMFLAVHLANTFILLAWLTLTAWWLSGGGAVVLAGRGRAVLEWGVACCAVLLTGTSGAVAALGDTLFPATSLGQALASDVSVTAHILVRLRVLHPLIAAVTVLGLTLWVPRWARSRGAMAERFARLVATLAMLQVVVGVVNIFLLAPVAIQLVHLLLADAVWIALILLGASVLRAEASAPRAAHAA